MTAVHPSAGLRFYTLATLAFVIASFAVQAASHFAINAGHYAGIKFMRNAPIMEFGFLTMVLQGAVLAYFYPLFYRAGSPVLQGLKFGLLMGVFLGSYIALVEPAKYAVPSIGEWIVVEALASLAQFSLYSVLLGIIYDLDLRRKT
jgi:hypothetical protein